MEIENVKTGISLPPVTMKWITARAKKHNRNRSAEMDTILCAVKRLESRGVVVEHLADQHSPEVAPC